MKVYCVATHSQGYYSEYLESAKKHNIDLIILGFGQKWGGFIWRFKLLIDALKKLNKNEIVMFTDAYDVIFLTSNEEIEKKFKSFNTRILVGITKNKNRFIEVLEEEIFGTTFLNAGMYMGYVSDILDLLTTICKYNDCNDINIDDQKVLNNYYINNRDNIKLDKNSLIFYNNPILLFKNPRINEFNIDLEDNRILIDNDIKPCLFHGPGNQNLDQIILQQNLKLVGNHGKIIIFKRFGYYLYFFKKHILILFICFFILNKLFKNKLKSFNYVITILMFWIIIRKMNIIGPLNHN